jgi:hypothetical protein
VVTLVGFRRKLAARLNKIVHFERHMDQKAQRQAAVCPIGLYLCCISLTVRVIRLWLAGFGPLAAPIMHSKKKKKRRGLLLLSVGVCVSAELVLGCLFLIMICLTGSDAKRLRDPRSCSSSSPASFQHVNHLHTPLRTLPHFILFLLVLCICFDGDVESVQHTWMQSCWSSNRFLFVVNNNHFLFLLLNLYVF